MNRKIDGRNRPTESKKWLCEVQKNNFQKGKGSTDLESRFLIYRSMKNRPYMVHMLWLIIMNNKVWCNVYPSKEIYHFVKKVFKNETGVRDIPDLLVCTPPKAGTTNWSKVLWQLKYLNELGILVDKDDKKYINYTNLYKLWFRNFRMLHKNLERSERSWKSLT